MVNPAKLRPPALRPTNLARARVDRLMDRGTELPLTVLQAGAGYGKTTALASWLAVRERPVAWLSLDASDDDPHRLLANVVAASRVVLDAPGLDAAERAVASGADLVAHGLPPLVRALAAAATDGLVLVLDDFHELRGPAVHELVCALIDQLRGALPMVIASRTKPRLRLARRVAAHEATLISAAELAFAPEETDELLNQLHGIGLDPSELGLVDSGLHGWPVGLSLLVLNMPDSEQPRRGVVDALLDLSAGRMVDYVIEEDMAHVSDDQRRLRLYASVLERVNGSLAAALLNDPGAPVLLEELREQGHLIASDGTAGGWLSIHDLMRAPLQMTLERDEPGMIAVIHERASRWFEDNAMIPDAMRSAVASGNAERVDTLLVRHAMALTMDRHTRVVREAMALEPAAGSESIPYREALDLLVQLLEGAHQGGLADRAWVLHERYADRPDVQLLTSLLVASPFSGDMARGARVGYAALERCDLPDYVMRLSAGLAGCLMCDGRYAEARVLVEPLITSGRQVAEIYAHSFLARINVLDGDPATAEWHGRRAVELLEASYSDFTGDFVWVRAALADVLRVNGRLTEARQQLDRSLEAERHRPGSVVQGIMLVSDAELCLAEGKRTRARTSIQRARQIYGGYANAGKGLWGRLKAVEADLDAPVATATTGSMPTPAERRVLEMLVQTPSRAAIANELYLSESTVKSHLRRIYRRLGARNRDEALAAARERGLLGDRRQPGGADMAPVEETGPIRQAAAKR